MFYGVRTVIKQEGAAMDMHGRKPERRSVGAVMLAAFAAVCMIVALWAGMHAWQGDHAGNVNDGRGNVAVADASVEAESGDGGDPLSDRRVYFAGFEDSVFGEKTKLELKNPQENEDFYMMYRIANAASGEILYESGLIESGRAMHWRPADALAAGVWHISIQMTPYYSPDDGETWTPLTSTDNRADFTILKSADVETDVSFGEAADRH